MLSVVKMLLKREVGGCELNSHGNNIVDHGKSWNCFFFNFCGNPEKWQMYWTVAFTKNGFKCIQIKTTTNAVNFSSTSKKNILLIHSLTVLVIDVGSLPRQDENLYNGRIQRWKRSHSGKNDI